ncbi:6-phosphogluconolactonase SOL4 NDAI_0B00950 [Naumovozyma dairenensis CBS 421]|uniref:Glucosamine/galactosamine-6-phosphate isomerase domain-containing protein n=1 Tax=Naumovozyma dairenensis (strain ATCC 10597 / BCRC 20456 / CBS 421 / NBRC 0211 / NRRL Y-12639) TaxID=1071378 RepID=G0W5R8_NAUDC|nr:hypothetical protein NDAI_0B00950 [Naumovozyma dairenensis CBS 421]CCD23129.1 hypothetical protein NDAI_0B00950 [Naumovozyma dairenensis CBS 421]
MQSDLVKKIIEIQNEVLKKSDRFKVGVLPSKGLIDKLSEILIDKIDVELFKQIKWPQWDIFLCEENLVEFSDPLSQYGQLERNFIERITHKGDSLNFGPVVITINESMIDMMHENKEIKIAKEFDTFLPQSLDLILTGFHDEDEKGSKEKETINERVPISGQLELIKDSKASACNQLIITSKYFLNSSRIVLLSYKNLDIEDNDEVELLKEIFKEEKRLSIKYIQTVAKGSVEHLQV